jgi:hypothetical protein
MSEHYPRIRLNSQGERGPRLYIRESLSLTFYMRRSHQEAVHDVLRALEVFRRSVKPDALAWYADSTSGDWEEFDSQGQLHVRRELLEWPAAQVWLRESPSVTTGYEFLYKGHLLEGQAETVTSAVSFLLPTEALEEGGPERTRELALVLARQLPFDSGHGGLCFNFPEGIVGTTEAIRELAFRYPGLDIPGLHFDSLDLGRRINGVHWLNFLGPPVLEALSGSDALRARLHTAGTTVQDLERGCALVTLGPWPEAGDLEQGRDLPGHQELARVLEPWLYLERANWGGFSDEEVRRWERRFL